MSAEPVIVRSDDPRAAELLAAGRIVTARSWGAQLDAADADPARLRTLVDRVAGSAVLRELGPDDVGAILALDAATLDDYPGGPATRHAGLTSDSARVPAPGRRGYGAFDASGALLAMTFVDLDPSGRAAETNVTVVDAAHRGRGLGTAVKAASLRALLEVGVTAFRTGGSSENAAIVAAGASLGYRVDEEWLTLEAPADAPRT
ncbi:acetyltransferase [Clavibacter michiganensis]|uniref:GNAT family N-acetyltransferase n=1 Tax=Clavibacter michiganensis TaxID=28447 RepID=UPI0013657F25|nr:GNAT family N-acetyltransferase [Clavibacter michiganensis]MDO4018035.1 acetyltransferase [Clavibacter michiganensis]MDO4037634.1 acetyltransferase [Clavibacter michiganensis]MDO4040983.1 acetyltransferase [Clavibacter michiganensis]MDO4050828.1 acetyltransferase [Clavibacter michiganensis]MDO4060027.1 acetyltransferase [Clavibacter michiganensis]